MLQLNIEQVENGWIVSAGDKHMPSIRGKQHVFNKAEDLADYVKKAAIGNLPKRLDQQRIGHYDCTRTNDSSSNCYLYINTSYLLLSTSELQ